MVERHSLALANHIVRTIIAVYAHVIFQLAVLVVRAQKHGRFTGSLHLVAVVVKVIPQLQAVVTNGAGLTGKRGVPIEVDSVQARPGVHVWLVALAQFDTPKPSVRASAIYAREIGWKVRVAWVANRRNTSDHRFF